MEGPAATIKLSTGDTIAVDETPAEIARLVQDAGGRVRFIVLHRKEREITVFVAHLALIEGPGNAATTS